MRFHLLVIASLVLASSPNVAIANQDQRTEAQRADEAEASLREMADGVFVKSWEEDSAHFIKDGISATDARKWGLWMAVGYSLGYCRNFTTPTDLADWNSAFDRIGSPKISAGRREEMRSGGLRTFTAGEKEAQSDPGDLDYCGPELVAVRRIVRSI